MISSRAARLLRKLKECCNDDINSLSHFGHSCVNNQTVTETRSLGVKVSMLSCPLKLPSSQLSTRRIILDFCYVVKQSSFSSFNPSVMKNTAPSIGPVLFSSFKGHFCVAVDKDGYQMETPHVVGAFDESDTDHNMQIDNLQLTPNSSDNEVDKEFERRKRIGRANKGRIPWNKGQKHNDETRERIRQRTKEALKDPKVRKKMSEAPRSMSNQTKARIQRSLSKLWAKRLRWKRSRERFMHSWAETIAEAAKIGGIGQEELDWDSYDKIKHEIQLLQIQQAAERAKAKELARVRSEKAAQVKASNIAMLQQKRRYGEESLKHRRESAKRNIRSKEEKEKLAEFNGLKLKERLLKIHKRKSSSVSRTITQHQRTWDKLNVDFAKREQVQKDISLADQIQFAKNRRSGTA